MLNVEFYLYLFLLINWAIYAINTLYQNYRMKKFMPNKKIEILTVPFYIFFLLSFYVLIKRIAEFFLTSGVGDVLSVSFWTTISIVIGIVFCLSSIILFSYVNFFDKSFPSCIAVKNNKPLKGIYKYVRHPSYYIFFFITFGNVFCLLDKYLLVWAIINHVCLYFYYMIEENQMRKTNYDYDKYLKKSNRFLPNFLKITANNN